VITADLLLHAYANAAFPMALEDGEIAWFSPDPRAIIPLETFHVPHGLRRALKKSVLQIRISTAFEEVMRRCGEREDTWINEEIIASYVNLHRLGYGHSVEAWLEDRLVGGLYGVAIGAAFFGESMFHEVTDASKIALHALITRMLEREFTLLDTQWITPHLKTFGAIEIPRSTYRRMLAEAMREERTFL
jgi:leucyl/phenylalanyl-tRNA--protein transferase